MTRSLGSEQSGQIDSPSTISSWARSKSEPHRSQSMSSTSTTDALKLPVDVIGKRSQSTKAAARTVTQLPSTLNSYFHQQIHRARRYIRPYHLFSSVYATNLSRP